MPSLANIISSPTIMFMPFSPGPIDPLERRWRLVLRVGNLLPSSTSDIEGGTTFETLDAINLSVSLIARLEYEDSGTDLGEPIVLICISVVNRSQTPILSALFGDRFSGGEPWIFLSWFTVVRIRSFSADVAAVDRTCIIDVSLFAWGVSGRVTLGDIKSAVLAVSLYCVRNRFQGGILDKLDW